MDEKELLKSIDERLARIERRQKTDRRLMIARVCTVLVIIAVLAAVLAPKVAAMAQSYREIVRQAETLSAVLSRLDAEKLGDGLEQLQTIDLTKLKSAVDTLSQIDFKPLQEAVDVLTEKLEPVISRFGGSAGA